MPDDTPAPVYIVPPASDRLWIDPRAILVNTYIYQHDVVMNASGVYQLAVQSSDRIMIGFYGFGVVAIEAISPWPDCTECPFNASLGQGSSSWYKLNDYGPIICNSWYVNVNSACTIRVVEIIRKG